ncbi:hypothetical protein WJX74_001240 [Apatococcus lobatus]|uniref:EamA domain-containing protein n=1 Tax=Apatococcus lobatus TaxID=904363 RepID=A0AAW1PRB1_9CHLO
MIIKKPQAAGFFQALLGLLPKWTPRIRGLVLLNLLVLLVATNWVVLRDTETFFDAFDFAALRFTIAAAAFSPFLSKAVKNPKIVQAGVELGAWSALGYLTQAQGLLTSDASRASFISTFTVLVVPLLSGLSGKGIRRTTIISGLVALVGVGLLESGGSASFDTGDLWNFASAIAFGIQVFRTEHHSRQLPQKSSLQLMSVLLLTIAAISVGAAGFKHPADVAAFAGNPGQYLSHVHPATLPWKQILYTGLLSTDVALWLEVIALQDVSSVEAAIIYTLEPVLGAAFAYLLLGERWGPAGWCGAALIVLSSLATQIWGSPDAPLSEQKIVETAKQATAGTSSQVSKAAQSLSNTVQSCSGSDRDPSQ